jgi:type II secretory pathway pseudopilin PulG
MLRTTNSELKTLNSRGFTLIEIIVLIVMAGILLPALIVPFATGVRGSGKPEMATTAMYLAHQKMEEFMKFDYSNAALDPTALTAYANADISTYQWQWQIEWVVPDSVSNNFNSSATDQGYKRILVRVKDPENDAYEIYSVVTDFP